MKKFDRKNYNMREVLTRLGIKLPEKKDGKIHCRAHGHEDRHPSCVVYEQWVHCYVCGFRKDAAGIVMHERGCDFKAAVQFLDGIQPPKNAKQPVNEVPTKTGGYKVKGKMIPPKTLTAVFDYHRPGAAKPTDADIIAKVARYDGDGGKKDFLQYSVMPDGKLYPCAPPEKLIYQQWRTANCKNIVIVEGEKAADALNKLMDAASWKDWCAITVIGGSACLPKADFAKCGEGKNFILWADNDEVGHKCMTSVAVVLRQCKAEFIVQINMREDWKPGYDAADFVNDGGTLEELSNAFSNRKHLETDPISVPTEAPADEPVEQYNPCEYADKFFPLGYNETHFFFYSVSSGKVKSWTARELIQANLIDLTGGIGFWKDLYGEEGKTKFSLSRDKLAEAQSDLIAACHNKGIYEVSHIYTRGWHMINGERILHTGNSVITKDSVMTIAEAARHFDAAIVKSATIPWGKPDKKYQSKIGEKWCALSDALLWEDPVFAKALVGWSALAPITGILTFRPAMWITGAAISGKSTIVRDTLPSLLGNTYEYRGQITAAAIKRKEVVAIGIDELEESKDDQNIRQERNKILKLMRITSGKSGPMEQAAGSGKETIEFCPATMFAYAGIDRHDLDKADTSRILNLRLARKHDESEDDAVARLKRQIDNDGNPLNAFLQEPDNNGNSKSVAEFLNFILTHIDELQEAIARGEAIAHKHNKAGRAAELSGAVFGAYAFTMLNGNIAQDNYKTFDALAEIAMTDYFAQLKREAEIAPSVKNPFQIILDHEIEVNFPSTTQFNKPFMRKVRVGVILNAVLENEKLGIPGYDGAASPDTLWHVLANFGIVAPLDQGEGSGHRGPPIGPEDGFVWIEAASADIKELFAKKCGYTNYQSQLTANGGELMEGRHKRRHSKRRVYFIKAAIEKMVPDFVKNPEFTGTVVGEENEAPASSF